MISQLIVWAITYSFSWLVNKLNHNNITFHAWNIFYIFYALYIIVCALVMYKYTVKKRDKIYWLYYNNKINYQEYTKLINSKAMDYDTKLKYIKVSTSLLIGLIVMHTQGSGFVDTILTYVGGGVFSVLIYNAYRTILS